MRIQINGTDQEVSGSTLAEVLNELGHGETRIATAVNEEFVPVAARPTRTLSEGDRVEIVTPRQGG